MTNKKRIHLASLDLVNFRGFESVNLTFEPQLTVLIGNNGAGKTTILEAVAGSLQYIKDEIQDQKQTELFKDTDIRTAPNIDSFEVRLRLDEPKTELKASYSLRFKTAFEYISGQSMNTDDEPVDEPDYATKSLMKSWYADNGSLEILAYYPCEAISVQNGSVTKFNPRNAQSAYDDVLNGRFNFSVLKKWLVYQFNIKQEVGSNAYFDRIADIITGEHGILNDEDEVQFSQMRVTYLRDEDTEGSLLFTKGDVGITEHQLSSGEKLLFALFADIARRLITANPKSNDPLTEGSGVVLIDEIDLHLHPKWQQKVVGSLLSIFPNVQFLVTSHSAEVLKGLDRKHIRILKNRQIISTAPFIKGRKSSAVLEDAFEIPELTPEYEEKIKQFYRAVETDKITARRLLDEIKEDFGEQDENVLRAESYFEIF